MKKIKQIVFPIAGKGTRMAPISNFIPKEMIPVIDKPVIHFAIDEGISAGFEEFIFVTNPNKTIVKKYVEETFPGIKSIFVNQDAPNGLGHAILCAKDYVTEDRFAVSLVDDLIVNSNPFEEMLSVKNIDNVIAAMEVHLEEARRYGIFIYDEKKDNLIKTSRIIEKPKDPNCIINNGNSGLYAVIGRYLLNSDIFNYLSKVEVQDGSEIQLADALNPMINNDKNLCGCIISGKRLDCGDKNGFVHALINVLLSDEENKRRVYSILGEKA